jgi:GNAT superfamily N-acetyltransferase
VTVALPVSIRQITAEQFPLYDTLPMHFTVTSVLRVEVVDGGLGGFRLVEEPLATPYVKDYDAGGDDNPTAWAREYDTSRWGIFLALDADLAVGGNCPVGGVAVAPDASMCPAGPFPRRDIAVVWDIRVHPDARHGGVGTALVHHAVDWARAQGCGQLVFETQNVNVPACRFYARMGCALGAIHRFGYAGSPEAAHEAMLLWYLDL